MRFNPRPALIPGESRSTQTNAGNFEKFQSTPGINTGRITLVTPVIGAATGFNPRPALIPGESNQDCATVSAAWFQSTPGINTGRIVDISGLVSSVQKFQSTPGINTGRIIFDALIQPVSIVSIHARH